MIGNEGIIFKVMKKVIVEESFKDLRKGRSYSNGAIVRGIRTVTFLRDWLYQGMLPRRRESLGFETEAKKAGKDRGQLRSTLPQDTGRNAVRPMSLTHLKLGQNPVYLA